MTHTTAPVDSSSPRNDRIDVLTSTLVELGTAWARHGLAVGRSALETSAKSLTATATILGQIADALESKRPEAADAPVEPTAS